MTRTTPAPGSRSPAPGDFRPKSVRASGLFPPDAFLAQRMLEARLLRPSYKVRSAVRKALTKAGGCAVGVHLRNRNRFFARRYTGPGRRVLRRDRNRSESAVEPVWARIKPLVAKHAGRGVFVAADGTSATAWESNSGSSRRRRLTFDLHTDRRSTNARSRHSLEGTGFLSFDRPLAPGINTAGRSPL